MPLRAFCGRPSGYRNHMPDEQDVAEMLDDDAMGIEDDRKRVEFPPDNLSALSQIGPLIDERLAGEPVAERAQREIPEAGGSRDVEASTVGRLADVPDDDPTDGVGESEMLADAFGDEADLAVEEQAVHLTDNLKRPALGGRGRDRTGRWP